VLDASESYLTPIADSEKYDNLTFAWICPASLESLCIS